MFSFIGLYRGNNVDDAKLIAVSAAPELVARFASELLEDYANKTPETDPVLDALNSGRRKAIRLVSRQKGAAHNG